MKEKKINMKEITTKCKNANEKIDDGKEVAKNCAELVCNTGDSIQLVGHLFNKVKNHFTQKTTKEKNDLKTGLAIFGGFCLGVVTKYTIDKFTSNKTI